MAISYGTYTITEVQEGSQIWTSSAAPTTPNYTFDVSHLTGDSDVPVREGDIILNSYYRYTVLSISSDGTTVLTGNRTSIRGATGAASVTYALIVSNLAIVKDKDGNLSPSTITVTAKSQTGSNAMANYTGRIKIETTTNNSTWTSRINEDAATKTYTIPSDTVAIRCSLYLKGGTTTLLDQQTVPVVSDGIDGTNGTNGKNGVDGKDAYTVILTNENHTFAGNTTSAIASEIECNIIAYKGTTQIAATIGTITGQPTGMTTEILNNGKTNVSFKVKVTTSMVTKNGVLNIPITVDGKAFTKKFTYTLTLDGEKGDKGDRGTNGASQNLLLDAYAPSLAKIDAPSARYFSDASNSTITGQFIAEDNLPDPNATHFVRLTDSSASTHGRGLCFYSTDTPPFINGHTYRIGCWVRKHNGSPKVQITLGSYGTWMPTQRKIENTEWEWIEVVRTFGDTDPNVTTQSDTYKRLYFYFYNNNVAGSSLDMCGFRMEEVQVNSGTARNFILGTEKLADWITTQGATISNGVVTFPDVTTDTWRETCSAKSFKYDLIRNQYIIFSTKVKADSGKKCRFYLNVSVDNDETTHIRQKYFDQYIYFTGDGEWQTVCLAVPVFDYMLNSGSGTVDFDDCWVVIRFGAANNYWNGFQAKEPQLSLGTTATSWTPAPEDIIVGKNLIPLSKNLKSFTPENLTRSIVAYTDDSCTITNTYGDTRYGVYYDIDVESGSIYTLSFQASDVSGTNINYGVGNRTPDQTASWNDITGDYKDVVNGSNVCTFTIPDTVTKVRIYFGAGSLNGTMTISNLKLEVGNRATEWTSAPEDIQYAMKVANNYLSMDETGIMIANMNDGEQKPSEATGRNVFIDNDSVDIRNGTTTLASFTGDNTKFYDPIYNKELATFGASGAMIGVEGEQRFVIEKDSVRAINSSGGTLFSIVSTDKTFNTEAEAAPNGECDDSPLADYITRTLDTGDSTTDNSFYIDRIDIIVSLTNSSKVLTNVKINSIAVTADRFKYNTNTAYGFPYSSSHSIDVPFSPAFSCNYGTSKSSDYVMTATFINDYGDSYNLTFSFKITYNGARKLTFWTPTEECIRTSGNNEAIAKFDVLNRSKYVFSQVISNTANTRAPAITFGTRTGEDGMLSSAFGQGLYAEKDGEFVIGRYNNQELQTDSKYSFVIGNGLTEEHRSNALTIDWSGNICLGIDVTGSETDADLLIAIQNAGWESSVFE